MLRRGLRAALPITLALAVAAGACSGDGDDDDGTDPTPEPTEFEPVGCQIVWVTRDPPDQTQVIDYYVLDAPAARWVTGTAGYFVGDPEGFTNVVGAFVDDYDLASHVGAASILATSGSFVLTVNEDGPLAIGGEVAFADAQAQEYFLIDTAGNLSTSQGESGTGSFDGVWTDPASPDVEEGQGTIEILYLGSTLTLGADVSYALCYDAGSSFAPATREQRIRMAGDRAASALR